MANSFARLGWMGGALALLLAAPVFASPEESSPRHSRFTPTQFRPVGHLAPRHGETVSLRQSARSGLRSGYNFPPPSRGDRFARRGLNYRVGIRGWRRYGALIKTFALRQGIDPLVVGAYIWLESEFDARQYYVRGSKCAVGLGSLQSREYPHLSTRELMDPSLNVKLTVGEFSRKWRPHDMVGTVMDVWYPSWRRLVAHGRPVPVIRSPQVYAQAIANRYYALREIDAHLRPWREPS
ncbi:MAG: hypothetical protein VKP62_00720 [Candidatus Sericytochromatia bacterium]|nr:hypothetical protein [Candidatus Sericytochromatia bacterium]